MNKKGVVSYYLWVLDNSSQLKTNFNKKNYFTNFKSLDFVNQKEEL